MVFGQPEVVDAVGGREQAQEQGVLEAVDRFFTLPICILLGLVRVPSSADHQDEGCGLSGVDCSVTKGQVVP